MNKTILIISFIFPPTNAAGVFRISKFVKYWHTLGWRIIVVTPERIKDTKSDKGLLADIPADVIVYKTKVWEPDNLVPASAKAQLTSSANNHRETFHSSLVILLGKLFRFIVRLLFIPDEKILWYMYSQKTIDHIVQKHKPDIIFSSAPPPTVHLIARRASKKFSLPWVADFRDEWTLNPFNIYPTPFHRMINRLLEKKVLTDARAIMTISDEMTKDFKQLATTTSTTQFHTVHNGYDEEDFADSAPALSETFTITYTGNFYGHRNPNNFFRALEHIINTSMIQPQKIRAIFAGANTFQIENDINFEKISSLISLQSYVAHSQAIKLMRRASVLLLIVSKESGNRSVTGKIFEYLASQRPILALVPPEGAAAKILSLSPNSIVCDPINVPSIVDAIYTLYQRWQTGDLRTPNQQSQITRFSRAHLAEQTSDIFTKILQS